MRMTRARSTETHHVSTTSINQLIVALEFPKEKTGQLFPEFWPGGATTSVLQKKFDRRSATVNVGLTSDNPFFDKREIMFRTQNDIAPGFLMDP